MIALDAVMITAPPKIDSLRPLHTGRLVLTPGHALAALPGDALAHQLTEIGLLGPPLPGADAGFAPGPALLTLVAYTGCAVQLDAAGPAGAPAGGSCVRLLGPFEAPYLMVGRNTRPPRCPDCGRGCTDWRRTLDGHDGRDGGNALLGCAKCGTTAPAWRWNWGRHGGCGRSLVCIEEVFPGEATPLPALMQALEDLGQGPWRCFYAQE